MGHLRFQKQRRNGNFGCGLLSLNGKTLETPVLWLGQEIDGVPRPWRFPSLHVPGLMLNAFEVLANDRTRERIQRRGLKAHLDFDGFVFMDSGGYLLQSNRRYSVGAKDVLSVYSAFSPDIAAVLDHPLRPASSLSTNRERWSRTFRNTRTMLAAGLEIPIVPVVHGYTLKSLEASCAAVERHCGKVPVIALGSLVPLFKGMYVRDRFLKRLPQHADDYAEGLANYPYLFYIVEAIKLVREYFPSALLHVFGVGSTTTMHVLFSLGVDSIDSSGWRLKAAHGAIQLPGYGDLFPRVRRDNSKTRRRINDEGISLLETCHCPICKSAAGQREKLLRVLGTSFRARAIHNAYLFLKEAERFRKARIRGTEQSFVTRRVKRSPRYSAMFQYALNSAG